MSHIRFIGLLQTTTKYAQVIQSKPRKVVSREETKRVYKQWKTFLGTYPTTYKGDANVDPLTMWSIMHAYDFSKE